MRMSLQSAIPKAPPAHHPLMADITGWRSRNSRSQTSLCVLPGEFRLSQVSPSGCGSDVSCPEEKLRPAPVRMRQWISPSASTASSASRISTVVCARNALSFSGRLNVIVQM